MRNTKNDMQQLTKEQAIALGETKFWEKLSKREIASFQLYQDLCCMPFGVFHEAMEHVLGRPVFTHEFADRERITAEFEGHRPRPSFNEILEMIPEAKRIVVVSHD